MTDTNTPRTVYVAMCGSHPLGVSEHRGDVQRATEEAALKHDKTRTPIRWEEDVSLGCWYLYKKNATTNRWNKSFYRMDATVVLDTPDTDSSV